MRRRLWLALSAATILITLSCNLMTPSAGDPVQPTSTPDRVLVPSTSPDPKRYINQEGGFSIRIPDDWGVAGPFEIELDGEAAYNVYHLGSDPSQGSGPGLSSIVLADNNRFSVAYFIASQCSTCPSHAVETVQIGTATAERTFIGGGGVPFLVEWYFIDVEPRWIGLSIHDPETMETLYDVLDTFRFE